MQKLIGILKMIVDCGVEELGVEGSLRQGSIPTKPRFRSVPDVADTKFTARNRSVH